MAEPPDETGTPLSAWTPCPPGTFERLAGRLRARRNRRLFLGSAAATLAVAAAAGGAWLASRPPEAHVYHFGGIACPEVVQLGPECAKGDLPKELSDKIHVHISECPNCGPYYKAHGWTT
jgi:hypothetical protein